MLKHKNIIIIVIYFIVGIPEIEILSKWRAEDRCVGVGVMYKFKVGYKRVLQ